MKPYLAIFRSGKSSLHPEAVKRLSEQNFDYGLSWFGDEHPDTLGMAEGARFVHMQKGAKWPGLERTLLEHWDLVQQYQYVWLPDDDLLCEPELVSRMFSICHDLQLELAQPALTRDSYFSHLITMQHTAFQLRFTNFVEIMAPVLSVDMLARVFSTIVGNTSGWGLDSLWPRMTQLGKVAIIDDTPVKHTRPIGGPNYAFNAEVGITAAEEAILTMTRYNIETPADFHINYAGLLQSGEAICIGQTKAEIDQILKKLIESTNGLKTSALSLTRYFSNHLNYWMDGADAGGPSSCPRGLLRVVLNHTLASSGLQFPAPSDAFSAQEAARQIAAKVN
mgnify:CR=1 FL=1